MAACRRVADDDAVVLDPLHAVHAELVVVEDCGHMSTMEQPDAVNNAFARWLAA